MLEHIQTTARGLSGWFDVESGDRNQCNCQLLIKLGPFCANGCRSNCLDFLIVAKDSNLDFIQV